MSRQQDDVDVLDKVFENSTDGREYTVDTEYGSITYQMHRVPRTRRQDFLNSLPDEITEFMENQEEQKREEFDVDELSELDDIEKARPDDSESPPLSVLDGDDIREFEDLILDSFEHESITDQETREFFDHWSDKQFYGTTFLIVGISADDDGVDGFRTE